MLKSRCRSAARRMLSPATGSNSTMWVSLPPLRISGLELVVDQTLLEPTNVKLLYSVKF
jgi:hypothetical protein